MGCDLISLTPKIACRHDSDIRACDIECRLRGKEYVDACTNMSDSLECKFQCATLLNKMTDGCSFAERVAVDHCNKALKQAIFHEKGDNVS